VCTKSHWYGDSDWYVDALDGHLHWYVDKYLHWYVDKPFTSVYNFTLVCTE